MTLTGTSPLRYVERSMADGVLTITLARPERLNALTAALLEELLLAVEEAADSDQVRVLILTGAGRGFCAGGDLAEGLDGVNGPPPLSSQTGRLRRFMRISQLLHDMEKPTIAAINGPCAGAGLSLALACDLRFASTTSSFVTAFVSAGVSGDFGGTWFLTRAVGTAMARRLYLLSERIDPTEAHRIGLVTKVVEAPDLLGTCQEVAKTLAARAPLAIDNILANLADAESLVLPEFLEREAARHASTAATADAREAAAAFQEKRTPSFQGR